MKRIIISNSCLSEFIIAFRRTEKILFFRVALLLFGLIATSCSNAERSLNSVNSQEGLLLLYLYDRLSSPRITQISPSDGIEGISVLGESILITFDREMDPATITTIPVEGTCNETIRISIDDFATCLGGTIASSDNTTFTYTPVFSAPLTGKTIHIKVTTDAKGMDGWYMALSWQTSSGLKTFSPADYSGLELWLDAEAVTGLGDSDSLNTWSDSSGQGNHAYKGTTDVAAPLYRNTGGPNNMSWIQFQSASLHSLSMDEFMDYNRPTLLIVGKSGGSGLEDFFSDWGGTSGSALFAIRADQPFLSDDSGNAFYSGSLGTAGILGSWSIITLRLSTSVSTYHVNGNLIASPTNTSYDMNTTWEISTTGVNSDSMYPRIGAHSDPNYSGGYELNGGISEMIMYRRPLSDTERARVECYLSRKYGISGPSC